MKRLLFILALLSASCSAQILRSIVHGGVPLAATVNCGTTTQAGTDGTNSGNSIASSCQAGANAGGYSVVSLQVYHGTGAGTIFAALYADDGGAPSLPSTRLCTGSVVVGATDNAFVTVPVSGCGNLSANQKVWIAQNISVNGVNMGTIASNCSPVRGTFQTEAPGTWSNPWVNSSTIAGTCWSQYVVLQPL